MTSPGSTRCRWSCQLWCSAYSGTVRAATASANFPRTSSGASRTPATCRCWGRDFRPRWSTTSPRSPATRSCRDLIRSEEHTSELQSHLNLVCRLLLEKKKKKKIKHIIKKKKKKKKKK